MGSGAARWAVVEAFESPKQNGINYLSTSAKDKIFTVRCNVYGCCLLIMVCLMLCNNWGTRLRSSVCGYYPFIV